MPLAATLFGVIGWADYLDGFTARLTGQFSRLGALLDPIIDRTLVISGMAVAWDFKLLPRWALAIVIARELLMVVLSRYGLRRGIEIKINWVGTAGRRADDGGAVLRDGGRALAGAGHALRRIGAVARRRVSVHPPRGREFRRTLKLRLTL